MSNVIAFPGCAVRRRRRAPRQDASPAALFFRESGIVAAILFENLDDPARALDKAARVVSSMPHGPARFDAEDELERLRACCSSLD